jgi:hypothetical protein
MMAVVSTTLRQGNSSPADLDAAASDQELGLDDHLNEGEEFRDFADEYEDGVPGGAGGRANANSAAPKTDGTPFDLGASPGPLAYSPTTGSPILFGSERDRDTPAPPLPHTLGLQGGVALGGAGRGGAAGAAGPGTWTDPNMPDLPNRMRMLPPPETAAMMAADGRNDAPSPSSPGGMREYFTSVGDRAAANGLRGLDRGGSPESLIETPPESPTGVAGRDNNLLTPPRKTESGGATNSASLPPLSASSKRNTTTAGGMSGTTGMTSPTGPTGSNTHSGSHPSNNQTDRSFGASSPAGMTELPFLAMPGSRLQTPAANSNRKTTTAATGVSGGAGGGIPPPSAGNITVASGATHPAAIAGAGATMGSGMGRPQLYPQHTNFNNTMNSTVNMAALRSQGGHDYYQQAGAGVMHEGALSLVRSPGAPPTPAGFGGPGLHVNIPPGTPSAVVRYTGPAGAGGNGNAHGDNGWQLGAPKSFQTFQNEQEAWEKESEHITRERERLSKLAIRTGQKVEDLAAFQGVSLVRRPRPPKPRRVKVSNTGFCVECDDYIWHALADLFGYKFADFILKSAAVQPTAEDEVELQSHAARVAGQGLTDVTTIFHKSEVHKSLRPTQEQEIRDHVRTYKRADDIWLQLLDDGTGRWFYYNVSSGENSWVAPPHFLQAAEFANAEKNQG